MSIDKLKINEFYECSDLALSAFLSMWHTLEKIDHTNPQRALFIFKRDEQIERHIEEYWRGQAAVNPQAYFQQLRFIKGRLYESR